jgi:hypothetical protein
MVYTIQNSTCRNYIQRLILYIKTMVYGMVMVFMNMLMCVIITQILLFCMSSGYGFYLTFFIPFVHKACYYFQDFFDSYNHLNYKDYFGTYSAAASDLIPQTDSWHIPCNIHFNVFAEIKSANQTTKGGETNNDNKIN